jgi:pyridinium-3,5-biscarboxylic acid mononucleotide synthase
MADHKFDFERRARIGLDEAVLCAGKSVKQIAAIIATLEARLPGVLLTRLEPAAFADLPAQQRATLDYDLTSRTGIFGRSHEMATAPPVAIVMAGTSDAPAAYEAARTLAFNGQPHRIFADVGVAGIWRLFERIEEIREAPVVIAVAGMDAALISVVGGLVAGAVIGLPTSVGYGVGANGATALGAGLASCAPGVVMVNIDNGYGAACAALRIMAMIGKGAPRESR